MAAKGRRRKSGVKKTAARKNTLVLALSTIDSESKAREIAGRLVEEHLAACVNIIAPVRSVYIWENKLCDESEWLLLIKTSTARAAKLQARLQSLHSYSTPEIIFVNLEKVHPPYQAWAMAWLADRASTK